MADTLKPRDGKDVEEAVRWALANGKIRFLWDWRGSDVAEDILTYRLILGEAKKAGVQILAADVQKLFEAAIHNERESRHVRKRG